MAAGSADTHWETGIAELIVFESATWGNAEGELMASAYATDCIIQSDLLATRPWSPAERRRERGWWRAQRSWETGLSVCTALQSNCTGTQSLWLMGRGGRGAFVWREIHTEQSIAKINTSLQQSNGKVQITMQGWRVSGSSFQLVLSAVAGDEGTIQKC